MSLPNSNGTGPSPRQLSLIKENGRGVLRDVDQNCALALWFSQIFGRRPSVRSLRWGLRVDRKRMHTIHEFLSQCRINHAVALDSALPFERCRYNINTEVRLAAWPMPRVALMQM